MSKLTKADAELLRTIADCLHVENAGVTADDKACAESMQVIAKKIDDFIDGAQAFADKWIVRRFP